MTSSLEKKQGFFTRLWQVHYRVELPLPALVLPDIIARSLGLLPHECFEGKPITDLKGRDPKVLFDSSLAPEDLPEGEELFCVAGRIFLKPSKGDVVPSPNGGGHFKYSMLTDFLDFDTGSHIRYSPTAKSTEDISQEALGRFIGRAVPFVPLRFRIAFEVFHPVRTVNVLPVTPMVTEHLHLDAWTEKMVMEIGSERLPNLDTLPLAKNELFGGIGSMLRNLLDFDLEADYRSKLRPT